MPAASSVGVKANGLLTNRTLSEQRMNTPPADELYELRDPYPEVPHVRLRLRVRVSCTTRDAFIESKLWPGGFNGQKSEPFRSFELLFSSGW
jgi:hypothetical protein